MDLYGDIYLIYISGNGLIDYDEFVKLMETRTERQSEDAEMRAYFAAFDKDHNGYIDAKELKTTLMDLGLKVRSTLIILFII